MPLLISEFTQWINNAVFGLVIDYHSVIVSTAQLCTHSVVCYMNRWINKTSTLYSRIVHCLDTNSHDTALLLFSGYLFIFYRVHCNSGIYNYKAKRMILQIWLTLFLEFTYVYFFLTLLYKNLAFFRACTDSQSLVSDVLDNSVSQTSSPSPYIPHNDQRAEGTSPISFPICIVIWIPTHSLWVVDICVAANLSVLPLIGSLGSPCSP